MLVRTNEYQDAHIENIKRQNFARIACKQSVKAHQILNGYQAIHLLKDLQKCRHSNICPHGRRVTFTIEKQEIAKKFQRTKIL